MMQYGCSFREHQFKSPRDLFGESAENEQSENSLATPYSLWEHDRGTLESIFTEQFLRSDSEANMYFECTQYDDFKLYRRTLSELWNVIPPNLRLVLGASTLGLVADRPIHSTLFILALYWEEIAPEDLKTETIMPQNVLNPIITNVLCVDENSKWSDSVEYSGEMKPLAWLGILANGDLSIIKKCAVLETTTAIVRKVQAFVASYLRPEQAHIFATLVDPPHAPAATLPNQIFEDSGNESSADEEANDAAESANDHPEKESTV